MSFQLELGLDLGLGEAAAPQVAVLLDHCGEIRPRGVQRGLGPPAAVGCLWTSRRHVVSPRWLMVEFC